MLSVTEEIDHHKEEEEDDDDEEECHANCVNISQPPTVTTPLRRSLSKNTVTCSSSFISHDINNDGLTERINHSPNNNNNNESSSSSEEECEIIVPIVSSSMFSTTTKKFPIPFSNRFKKRRKRKKKRRISEISWGQNIEAVLVGVAAFIANTIIIGFIASLAIYYVEFKDAFSDSHGLISLSVFLPTGIFGSVGLLSGMFLNKFGVRITAITGSLLLAIGVGVCAYVPNVIFLFVFLGAFAGTGCSFVYLSVTMGLCSYFKLKGRLLMPLVTMGEAAGTIIFPPLTSYLIEIYFWRGSLLLMSGVMLQSTVCAMMYSVKNLHHQEIKSSHKKQTKDKYPCLIDGKNDTNLCKTLSNSSLPTQTTNVPPDLDSPPQEQSENLLAEELNVSTFMNPNFKNSNKNKENSKNSVDDSFCKESKELEAQDVIIENNPRENSFLDPVSNSEPKTNADLDSSFKTGVSKVRQRDTFLSIVKNKQYVLFLMSVFVIAGCINTTLTVLPDFCVYQGLTLSESANIYAIGASGDALSRIIGGWLLFRNQFSSLVIFTVSGIVSGLLTAIYPLLSSFYLISILSFFVMFHSGLLFSVYSVVIMDFFDINHYAIAIGLSETVAGCGVVTIGYIIGFLTEYNNGSYMVSFYLIAAISVTCMLPMLILCLYKRRKVSVKNP